MAVKTGPMGLLGQGTQAVRDAAAANAGGGGLLGGGGLGGLLGGVGDFFQNQRDTNPEFLTALGIGLMSGDMPGALTLGQEQARMRRAQEAEQAYRTQSLAQDESQFNRRLGLEEREFGLRQNSLASETQQKRVLNSSTAKTLRGMGPDYEPFAQMADAGAGADAFNAALEYRRTGNKPVNLESVFDAQGREQKGFFQGSEFVPVGGAKAADSGMKPPSGYMWDPNDQSRLTPIPGGPGEQIPGELAARVGLADNFLTQVPGLLEKVKNGSTTGPWDQMMGASFSGSDQAEVMRGLQSGTDALMRMLTGAGMNATEAEAYARRYLPTYTDNATSAAQKVKQLDAELRTIREKVMQGRGGTGAGRGGAADYRNRYGLE